jgi:hypothetical protein
MTPEMMNEIRILYTLVFTVKNISRAIAIRLMRRHTGNRMKMTFGRKVAPNRNIVFGGILLLLIVVVLFAPFMYQLIRDRPGAYRIHVLLAEKMVETGQFYSPHPLYQLSGSSGKFGII